MLTKKRSRLAKEILGLIVIAGLISAFFYGFIYFMSQAIVEIYNQENGRIIAGMQGELLDYWLRRISLIASVIVFLVLYLTLTGQKLIYIREIIEGVEALQRNKLDIQVPIEGEDELTQLAESVNYLAKSQMQIQEKEKALSQEKDAFIRTLSHDIRTPLTSILAMSEYYLEKDAMKDEEVRDFLMLVKSKSAQIKILTDRLLNEGQRNPEYIENGKLLFEQLAEEWMEFLEAEFDCQTDIENCEQFSSTFDITELQRIFDNLASNVQKYADTKQQVLLTIATEEEFVVINQRNFILKTFDHEQTSMIDSYGIGLQSIERLAKIYGGTMEVFQYMDKFEIKIKLKICC